MTQTEILTQLRDIECELSPENLYCDGEISHAQAQQKYQQLTKERNKLVKMLGREPTYEELYGNL